MKTLACLGIALLCTGLQAQTVYRCGPDGREYSQSPCPQGRAVNVGDARSDEQRAAAEAVVREAQTRGDALERERLDREAGRPPAAGTLSARPAAPAASHTKATSKKKKKRSPKAADAADRDFKAVAPPQKKAGR